VRKREIEVIGAPGSPYTRKLVALLRYRRIPYVVHWRDTATVLQEKGVEPPKVALLPTVLLPDGEDDFNVAIDSTPILRGLDERFSRRRVRPVDPALALVDALLEDFADEWGTKLMFHYRWHFNADADFCAIELPLAMDPQMPSTAQAELGKLFKERQQGRLRYVGSNDVTAPIIEAAYLRLLKLLDEHFATQRFLLGRRPCAGDFALFGQLSQLALFDPTPRTLAHEKAPRVVAWTTVMDDLSGISIQRPAWVALEEQPLTLRALLEEIGRVYAPLLLANAQAIAEGQTEFETAIDGALWAQQTFPYQAKCLGWLREEYVALTDEDPERFDCAIKGTGCEVIFSD
jgi:glutathione S-transferase